MHPFPIGEYDGTITTWWLRPLNMFWLGKRFAGLDVFNNVRGNEPEKYHGKVFRSKEGFDIHYADLGITDTLIPVGDAYVGRMKLDALPWLTVRFTLRKKQR